ncbi:MAG TPA: hypothetical protein PKA64_24300, partial [Myxococcota bacterium]|nr:hypothetical protein [Myxococcota bacterium]
PGLPLTLRALHDAGYERIYLRGDGGRTTAHGVDGPLGADPTSPAFAARLAASYGPDPVNALTCRAGAAVPADGWLVPPLAIRRDPRAQLDARAWRWPEGWAPG